MKRQLCKIPIWIRAGVIIGSGNASFEIIRNLTQKLPIVITPLWVRTRTQPVGIEDVLAYLESSISLPNINDIIVDIGSENLSFQDMMQQAFQVMGIKRFLIAVPVLSPKLSSYWLILFTPIPYRLASALVEGLKSETTLQNTNAAEYYKHITPSSFQETVRLAIDELGQQHVVSRWCGNSGHHACDIRDFDDPNDSIYRDMRIVAYSHGEHQEDVLHSACSIGGQSGWFKYDFLWRLRGLFDKLAGGNGLSRERRLEGELRVGDVLDFWKVADLKKVNGSCFMQR